MNLRGKGLLHHAAQKGATRSIAYLLGRGADPNARDKKQRTPLHQAVLVDGPDSLTSLLAHSKQLDINAVDAEGRTPLHYAAYLHHLIQVLRSEDIPFDSDDLQKELAAIEPDVSWYSSLDKEERKSMMEMLLKHKADPTIQDKHGKTPATWKPAAWVDGCEKAASDDDEEDVTEPSDNEEWYDATPLSALEQKDVDDMRKRMRLARTAKIKNRADAKEGEEEYSVWECFQVMNPNTRSFAELVIEALNHPHQAVILPGLINARLAPAKPVTEACMVLVFHPCPEIRESAIKLLPDTPRGQLLRKQSKEAANDPKVLQAFENTMRKLRKQAVEQEE